MGGADIKRTLDGILAFVSGRRTRAAVVVRRLLGHPDPADAELSEHLIREIRRRTRIDGSMGGSLADTAWSAWELMELGCLTDCAGLVRMVSRPDGGTTRRQGDGGLLGIPRRQD